jgi:exosortase/archaeosortase family protein
MYLYNTTKKTKKFVVLYFFYLATLFITLYLPTNPISILLNQLQTDLTLYGIEPFLKPNQLIDVDIWINPHYKIIITQACNGMIPILFLYASILAYPTKLKYKLIWIIIGYIFYVITNILRLIIVTKVTEIYGSNSFYLIHDIIGNALLMIVGLSIFILFIKTSQTTT